MSETSHDIISEIIDKLDREKVFLAHSRIANLDEIEWQIVINVLKAVRQNVPPSREDKST